MGRYFYISLFFQYAEHFSNETDKIRLQNWWTDADGVEVIFAHITNYTSSVICPIQDLLYTDAELDEVDEVSIELAGGNTVEVDFESCGQYEESYLYIDGRVYDEHYEYYHYDIDKIFADKDLLITYSDGSTEKMPFKKAYDEGIITVSEQQRDRHWKSGGSYNVKITHKIFDTTVVVHIIPGQTVVLSETKLQMPINSTYQLSAKVKCNCCNYDLVDWKSSNEEVATVDGLGVVTAHKLGTAVITATSFDTGDEASCIVDTRFTDVSGSNVSGASDYQYYYNPVYWAADKNITTGYNSGANAGKFGVGLECTREDFATFLYRFAGSPTQYSNGKKLNATDVDKIFPDVAKMSNTSVKKKAIAWAYGEGIINGYTKGEYAGKFGVGVPIDRRSAMIMIWRHAGNNTSDTLSGSKTFTDVVGKYGENSDSYKAIAWAANNGITSGLSKTQADAAGLTTPCFGCSVSCTREQMITFLYRYYNLM